MPSTDAAEKARRKREWNEKNREHVRDYSRSAYQRDRDASLAKSANYYRANAERIKAQAKARHAASKLRANAAARQWRQNNPERKRAYKALAISRNRQARPPWLSIQQRRDIVKIYAQRRELTRLLGDLYHVDHIVPIVSDVVCGLHVPWNLQIISASENGAKRNHFDVSPS